MTARYVPVGWTRVKWIYDAVLLASVAAYIYVFTRVGPLFQHVTLPPDDPTTALRAFGTCAFLMLTCILCIGPLARLDRRFLPLLYNRRHFGVLTCAVAAAHGMQVLGWYFAFSDVPPTVAVLGIDTHFDHWPGIAFIPFGIAGFLVLLLLASTSHDFWLHFLTPPVWKALHMAIYPAYALIVLHICLGALQAEASPLLSVVVALSVALLLALHLTAAWRGRAEDRALAQAVDGNWILATSSYEAVAEGRAIVVHPRAGEAIAVFRHDGRLSAVSNMCAHQNGPLGEGRIVDGCITCPWHGYQYRPEDGCSPPPFTERVATYPLRLDGERVLVNPTPNPIGTVVEPLSLPASTQETAR